MTTEEMRSAIITVQVAKNPNSNWKKRVKQMPASQVQAIYFSFLQRGMFNPKPKKEAEPEYIPYQFRFSDYI